MKIYLPSYMLTIERFDSVYYFLAYRDNQTLYVSGPEGNYYGTLKLLINIGNHIASIVMVMSCQIIKVKQVLNIKPNGGSTTSSLTTVSYARLVNNKTPSLSCSKNDSFTVNESSTGNGKLTYPVGLLTADEVAYAGGRSGSNNTTYYLYTGSTWWTMSPSDAWGHNNYVYLVYYEIFEWRYPSTSSEGVRPSFTNILIC